MANKCVCFVTDNAALVEVINRQTSKHKLIMLLVRNLVLTSLKYNILFRARHIAGIHNSCADLLFRLQVSQFKQIFPEADDMPTQVPDNLMPKSWSLPWTLSFLSPVGRVAKVIFPSVDSLPQLLCARCLPTLIKSAPYYGHRCTFYIILTCPEISCFYYYLLFISQQLCTQNEGLTRPNKDIFNSKTLDSGR